MVMQYSITGGYLKIQKNAFIQEMLRKDSQLRVLLNWKTAGNSTACHPSVSEPDWENIITIDFTGLSGIDLNESPEDILNDLKARYKEKIKGKVAYKAVYSMYGGVFHFEIDL